MRIDVQRVSRTVAMFVAVLMFVLGLARLISPDLSLIRFGGRFSYAA